MIYNEASGTEPGRVIVDIVDVTIHRNVPSTATFRDLLIPIFRSGELCL
jgi:hypothetical protein